MKKIIFLMVLLASVLFTTTAFAIKGEGTEESPFEITNQGELELVTDFPDCHFKLMNDIELEGTWIPLCKQTSSGTFKGVFDGAGYTISNLIADGSGGGLFSNNSGIIKNIKIIIAENGMTSNGAIANSNSGDILNCSVKGNMSWSGFYMGGICAYNFKKIEQCSFEGIIKDGFYSSYTGGICGESYENSNINKCIVLGTISGKNHTGGICGHAFYSRISNCYFIGEINNDGEYAGGISGYSSGYSSSNTASRYYMNITGCYAVPLFDNNGYGITGYPSSSAYLTVTSSYYDKAVSGLTDTNYGTPKSTAAMKMKKTYTDGGWDFENVWGIDPEINDGYPYLLWEYAEPDSASAEIVNATSTDNSLKFISAITTSGNPSIAAFGTTLIPLWLFETGSNDTVTVEYDNSQCNIKNADTFGATLLSIPESCKNMLIVGKSYIKDASGAYTWSTAKSASVNNPTLRESE